jgi:TP901 family phage tail tape measure protein
VAGNVVEILVKATDDTSAGFGASKASAAASADEIAAAQDRVTAAENKLRDAQISQTDAQLRLAEIQAGEGGASADVLAAAQDRVTQATIRAADAQIRLGDADEALAGKEAMAGDAGAVQAEKMSLTSRMSGMAGAGLAKFGAIGSMALAGIGYESIKMAMSFQQATERLVTQAGVPQKELGSLRSGILGLAGAVGFSPDSLAESLYHVASNMASLGATAPQMLGAVKIAAEGAKVGGANLEDVTNALTAAIASGIPGVQNYSQAMGALNAIVGAGDMKMQDLSEAMGSGLMAVVKGYGLSLKDVGAALDVFGDNNIRGAHAATDLRIAVQALAVPAAAGKAQLASMGLSMQSLGDTMRQHGLLAALQELQARFKAAGVTAQEQGGVITEIFGKKAGVGLAVLMDQMDRLKSKYPDITAGANNFGQAWAATQQTTKQRLDELRATFDALGTSIGMKLLPAISSFAGFLDKNRAVLQALAPIILAIVAAMAAWAGVMKVIEILSDLSPWTIAIMAVIAAVVLLVEHWRTVEQVAKDVFHAVSIAVDVAREGIITAGHAIENGMDSVREAFVSAGHGIESVFDAVTGFIQAHWKLILAITTGGIGLIIDALVTHWGAVKHGFEDAYNFVAGIVKDALGIIKAIISPWIQWNEDVFRACWSAVQAVFRVALGVIEGYVRVNVDVIKAILGWFGKLGDLFRGWFDAAANAVRTEVDKLLGFVESIPGRINSALGGLPGMMFRAGVHVIESLLSGITSMIGQVGSTIGHIASKIAGFFGLSPAIEGPLSGGGAPEIRGQHFAADLARGMASGQGPLAAAAQRLAGAAAIGPAGGGGYAGTGAGAGAPLVIQFTGGGGSGLEQQFWVWFKAGIRAQGGDPRLVNKKVAFL